MVPENKKTEDTNKSTLLVFKIIAIIHNRTALLPPAVNPVVINKCIILYQLSSQPHLSTEQL
jgi:hypothetical protein